MLQDFNRLDRLGTIVYRAKRDFGLYWHAGFVSGRRMAQWLPVTSFGPGGVVRKMWHLEEDRIRIARIQGDLTYEEISRRCAAVAHYSYNIRSWNCEHFVRHCHGLRAKSPQAERTVLLGLGALALALGSRNAARAREA